MKIVSEVIEFSDDVLFSPSSKVLLYCLPASRVSLRTSPSVYDVPLGNLFYLRLLLKLSFSLWYAIGSLWCVQVDISIHLAWGSLSCLNLRNGVFLQFRKTLSYFLLNLTFH